MNVLYDRFSAVNNGLESGGQDEKKEKPWASAPLSEIFIFLFRWLYSSAKSYYKGLYL